MSYPQLGEDYEDSGLGKRKFKVGKAFKKVRRAIGGTVAGATAGLIPGVKPGMVGVKSKAGKKFFRVGRVVGAITAVAYAAPFVASKLGAQVGMTKIGALKFLGGKLVSAPKKLLSKLKSKGIDPKTATPEQVLQAGQETGDVTPSLLDTALEAFKPRPEAPEYPGGSEYPAAPPTEGEMKPVVEAGMFGGPYTIPLIIGTGFVAMFLFGGKKGRAS